MFLPFCHNTCVWQTDGQTDRILMAIPRLHCMQRSKNDNWGTKLWKMMNAFNKTTTESSLPVFSQRKYILALPRAWTCFCLLTYSANTMMSDYLHMISRLYLMANLLTSARRDVLLSAIGRLLLPALDFGIVCLLTSGLPRHLQHFVRSWKLIYFGNLTQTLCYNCVTIVVLAVTLT